jgi:putative endonuclease
MAKHIEFGNWGEQVAAKHLESLGYKIVETNYRFRKGEIDLITTHHDQIVFFEVRTRRNEAFIDGKETISSYKEALLIDTANHYIESKDIDLDARFDIIVIVGTNNPEIKHIEEAIQP